jgi:hypothetical protein
MSKGKGNHRKGRPNIPLRDAKPKRERVIYIGNKTKFTDLTFIGNEAFIRDENELFKKADYVFSEVIYARLSGKEKVVNSIINQVAIDTNMHLLQNYGVIFAIDANHVNLGDRQIMVTSVYQCTWNKINEEQIRVSYGKYCNILCEGCGGDLSERFGWFKLIQSIRNSPNYHDNLKVGIISDHDLGKMVDYNSGRIAIFDDYYLPRNINLIYASSDVSDGSIVNILISECEKDAKKLLDNYKTNKSIELDGKRVEIKHFPNVSFIGFVQK